MRILLLAALIGLAACDSAFAPSSCATVDAPGLFYDEFLSDPDAPVLTAIQNTDGADLVIESAPIGSGTWTVFHTWLAQSEAYRSIDVVGGRDYRALSHFSGCPDSAFSGVVTVE